MKKIISGTCECYNTGGNCFCGYCQFEDGTWFAGAVNEFGGIWDTKENAENAWIEEDEGFLRWVEDLDEQTYIWETIYKELISTHDCESRYFEYLLPTVREDLKSQQSQD